MVQNIVNYADNPTGPELLDDYLAKEQENILSSNSGIQRPSYASAGTAWIDTSVTPWLYKIYDGSEDVVFGSINPTTHSFIASGLNETNLVHKTGIETITGVKTFRDDILAQGNITLGTSTNTWGKQLQFRDTTGKRIARIQPMAIDTSNNRVGIWVNNADNTVEKGISIDSNGTTYAPTPSAGDNSTKIATTAWVNDLNNSVVHKTGDETISGVKTFNGAVTITTATVTGTLNIPGGKIWIA